MARTPADRIATMLRARDADRAALEATIATARADYAARWPAAVEALLDDAAHLAGLDERPPAPEPRVRTPRVKAPKVAGGLAAEVEDEIARLLALPIPKLAPELAKLASVESLHRIRSAEATGGARPAYLATIDAAIKGAA